MLHKLRLALVLQHALHNPRPAPALRTSWPAPRKSQRARLLSVLHRSHLALLLHMSSPVMRAPQGREILLLQQALHKLRLAQTLRT